MANDIFFKTNELMYKKFLWYNQRAYFRYRRDPVPRTGINGGARYNYYRRMRTYQERRINSYHSKEYGDIMRIRGNRANLPSSWDDYPRELQKSWKKYGKRKKQWMRLP